MRWYIVRTLLHKEILRQLANRGGIALASLLVVAALLMAVFSKKDGGQPGTLMGGVDVCFLDYWQEGPWIDHLRAHVPQDLKQRLKFRCLDSYDADRLVYPPGSGAIQVRVRPDGGCKIVLWHPGQDSSTLTAYETWFWRESAAYFQRQAQQRGERSLVKSLADLLPGRNAAAENTAASSFFEQQHSQLKGGVDLRSSVTSALVLFALFFACVYLMPSLMCEERERGILLAQALSPASPLEILAAKFLFYPLAGMVLAALLSGINNPAVLAQPFFWLVLTVAAFGSLGIGLTIACLARTQRTASMGALCYMLVVALFLFICQQGGIGGLPNLALEYHCPRILHAVLSDALVWYHWINLAAAAVLAVGWCALAAILFRHRGWQ